MQPYERGVEQVGHSPIPIGRRIAAQNHAHEPSLIAHNGGCQIVASGAHVPGFQAISAGIAPQQIVVIGVGGPLIGEAGGGEAAVQAMLKADDTDKEAQYAKDRELSDKLMWQEMNSDASDEEDEEA